MHGLLERSPRVQMVVEFLPAALTRAGHDPGAFLRALEGLGFRLHEITPRGRFRPTTIDRLLTLERAELYLRR